MYIKRYARTLSIIGICAGMAVMAMIFSMVNTALPAIHTSLKTSIPALQWVMNIFGILTCSTLVIFGRLADIYGRKKIFLFGLLMQGLALLGSGLASSITTIIFFQALAGISNAIILAISQAMLTHTISLRSRAIGLWAAVIGFCLAIGPLLSGLLISLFNWHWVFLAPLPIVILGIFLVSLFAEESKNKLDLPKLDIIGALLLAATISCFILGVIQGHLWHQTLIAMLYTFSAIFLVLLLIVEKTQAEPIIREDLFTNMRFLLASLTTFCLVFFIWAAFFLMPFFLQIEALKSPLYTGIIMLFVTIPVGLLSPYISKLYHRVSAKNLIFPGFIILLLSALLQLRFTSTSSSLLFIMAALLFGIGWSFIWGPSTTAAISTLSQDRAGIASGTFMTIQEIGGTVGLAITVTIARSKTNFSIGFHASMWVLATISLVGLIAALLLNDK